jgi:hypothetical protein
MQLLYELLQLVRVPSSQCIRELFPLWMRRQVVDEETSGVGCCTVDEDRVFRVGKGRSVERGVRDGGRKRRDEFRHVENRLTGGLQSLS